MSSTEIPPPMAIMSAFTLITYENEVFRSYVIWSMILVIKMLSMSYLTGVQRFRKQAYSNPEDVAVNAGIVKQDEEVERVRRAHLNDMENIYLFFVSAFVFMLTDPNPDVAMWLYRIFGAIRILHTFVYAVYPIRQPARVICFAIGSIILWYMAIRTIVYFT